MVVVQVLAPVLLNNSRPVQDSGQAAEVAVAVLAVPPFLHGVEKSRQMKEVHTILKLNRSQCDFVFLSQ